MPDYALDIEHRNRVDTGERLVEQDELRIGGQRPRNLDATPLAAREADAGAGPDVADVQFLEELVEFLLPAGPVEFRPVFEDR